jgi:hypothetical protein
LSKLYCARKRGYAELPLASKEWFIKKLKEDHTSIFKPKVPEYLLEKQWAIAYLLPDPGQLNVVYYYLLINLSLALSKGLQVVK